MAAIRWNFQFVEWQTSYESSLVVQSTTEPKFNIYHNKHHILHIVMDETTKFTSHMCHRPRLFVGEKPHFLIVWLHTNDIFAKGEFNFGK
jgi:hypothetical protein